MKVYFTILLGMFCAISYSIASEKWTHHTVLDGDGRYHLYWRPPKTKNGESEIAFKVEVEAHGYVGFGLSPNGGMSGSDIVTGWIKNGVTYFQDRFATGDELPRVDTRQDWKLLNASQNDTHTILKFSRKLDTCDKEDLVIDDSTMRVIYAYSEQDPQGEHPIYHKEKRGTKSILLLQSKVERKQVLDDPSLHYWDVKLHNYTIPAVHTMYWCKIFKTPQLSQKNHIVYVKPMIQEGNEKFVHHILIYECVGATFEEYEGYEEHEGHQCHRPNMPDVMKKCEGVTLAWGVGGDDMVFPEHVGLPLDPAPGKYFLFEIHYDNPQNLAGIVDGSGLRIYYTQELRKYDAGCLMLGATISPRAFVPPGQNEYTVTGHSNPKCLDPVIPEEGLKVLGVLVHAHLAGRKLKVRHFRKNKELPPLTEDKNYDFNYQEYRYFTKEVDILQGDQITVECTYDTSNRTMPTFGGESTQEEMCLTFILYYPRVNRFASLSAPTLPSINEALNTNLTRTDLLQRTIYPTLKDLEWDKMNISEVEHSMRFTEHNTLCLLGDGKKDILKNLISYPKDIEPHLAEQPCAEVGREEDNNSTNSTRKEFGNLGNHTVEPLYAEVGRAEDNNSTMKKCKNSGNGSRSSLNIIIICIMFTVIYLIKCV